jgi:hypothetical protein
LPVGERRAVGKARLDEKADEVVAWPVGAPFLDLLGEIGGNLLLGLLQRGLVGNSVLQRHRDPGAELVAMFGGYSEHMSNDPDGNVLGVVDCAVTMALSYEAIDQLVADDPRLRLELCYGLRREWRNQCHPHRPVFRRIGGDGRRIDPVVTLPDHYPLG